MKVSEIQPSNIATYLRLDTGEYTDQELQVYIDVAKKFIKSYTGLEDVEVTSESVATGDGVKTIFNLDYKCVIADSQTIYIDGVAKTVTTDYTINKDKGVITFVVAPSIDSVITADYNAIPSDQHEDFVIVVYVLCQDMYDTRTLYVDKNNMNKVVESILGMHSTNLL